MLLRRTGLTRAFLAVSLLMPELLVSRIAGNDDAARMMLALQAAMQIALAVVIYFIVMRSARRWTVSEALPEVGPGRKFAQSALVFGFVTVIALAIGLLRGNSVSFALGDTYKFMQFLIIFGVLNLCISSRTVARNAVVLTFMFLVFTGLLYSALYLSGFYPLHTRPMAIYACVWLPALTYALRRSGWVTSRAAIIWMAIVFVIVGVITWYSQSLTFAALVAIQFCGAVLIHRRKVLGRLMLAAMGAVLVAGSFIAFSGPGMIDQGMNAVSNGNFYLTRKFSYFAEDGFSVKTLELMGGDRVAQAVAVVEHMLDEPQDAVIGQGMGGEVHVTSVTGLENRTWKQTNHYIEAGYPQVLLRTGVIGLLVYIGMLATLVRRGLAISRTQVFGALSACYFIYVSVFSAFNESLLGAGMSSLYMVSLIAVLGSKSNSFWCVGDNGHEA